MSLPVTPPSPSGAIYGPTPGIERNMDVPEIFGGGDQNGTASTSILHGQAGTAASKIATPRNLRMSPNYCGVV